MPRKQTAQADVIGIDEPDVRRPEPEGPRRARQAKAEGSRWRERVRKLLLWSGVAAAVGGGAFGYYRVDQFLASDARFTLDPAIRITGITHTPGERVQAVFARDIGRSVYLVRLADRRRSLLAIDWVKDATVARRWPNRIAVTIVERTPVAFLLAPGGGEPALIDEEGVILSMPQRADVQLPVLTGVTREQSPAVRRQRIAQFLELMKDAKNYAGQISEVDVGDPSNLKVTMLDQSRAFRLWLGSKRYHDRMMNFTKFYAEISRRLPYADTFDLRLDDRITVPADANPAPPPAFVNAKVKAAKARAARAKAQQGAKGGR